MPSSKVYRKGIRPEVLIIEPFYGGSHQELIDVLVKNLRSCTLVTLPAKKWHWRSRCGALSLLTVIPNITTEKVLFCSSVLNLAELIGIRPDLISLKKVVYFHENQLIYPVQEIKQRDIQYPYNQITSCLAADAIFFNSYFNMNTFLDNFKKIIKIIPDCSGKDLERTFREKCSVLYFPIEFPEYLNIAENKEDCDILKIVWPHRWEFDKGPDEFFDILIKLKSHGCKFRLIVLGECYKEVPSIFINSQNHLKNEIIHCGFIKEKEDYFKTLSECHVAVSTSKHEFFGVAMLESYYCGCLPLVPNSLVYPEIYPVNCLYKNLDNLYSRLKHYCENPMQAIKDRHDMNIDISKYSHKILVPQFLKVLNCSKDDSKSDNSNDTDS